MNADESKIIYGIKTLLSNRLDTCEQPKSEAPQSSKDNPATSTYKKTQN